MLPDKKNFSERQVRNGIIHWRKGNVLATAINRLPSLMRHLNVPVRFLVRFPLTFLTRIVISLAPYIHLMKQLMWVLNFAQEKTTISLLQCTDLLMYLSWLILVCLLPASHEHALLCAEKLKNSMSLIQGKTLVPTIYLGVCRWIHIRIIGGESLT